VAARRPKVSHGAGAGGGGGKVEAAKGKKLADMNQKARVELTAMRATELNATGSGSGAARARGPRTVTSLHEQRGLVRLPQHARPYTPRACR
jgi:hypothetical protein